MEDRLRYAVWHREDKRWLDVYYRCLLSSDNQTIYVPNLDKEFNENQVDIVFCTGFRDKIGSRVFDGDYLEGNNSDSCLWLVVWDSNGWYLKRFVNNKSDPGVYGFRNDLLITGNKFENPELLKLTNEKQT